MTAHAALAGMSGTSGASGEELVVTHEELLLPHEPGTRQAIKDHIAVHGIEVPIVRDESGRIVDGVLRWEIAQELDIACPEIVHAGPPTEGEFIERRIKLNLLRRHIGPVAWARSFEALARQRGVRLGVPGRQLATGSTMSLLAKEFGVTPPDRGAKDEAGACGGTVPGPCRAG